MKKITDFSLPFAKGDPAACGLQFLENVATGYWYSQVLFTAIEIDLFSHLEKGITEIGTIATAIDCRSDELTRLLRALEKIKLVVRHEELWMNSIAASRYLVRDKKEYMGEFLLYRQYMQANWQGLTERVRGRKEVVPEPGYEERNFRYVRAMDSLVRQKAGEIAQLFAKVQLDGPVLDVGGGAGSLLRAIRDRYRGDPPGSRHFTGELFELAEVIAAAKKLYPHPDDWQDIGTVSGDFRLHEFNSRFAGVILSNFLHAYGPEEAGQLLIKALSLVDDGGFILIHDYFPDRSAVVEEKGALYDLCMMLNTYNGSCHEISKIRQWLQKSGSAGDMRVSIHDLPTDSALILIGGSAEWHSGEDVWLEAARELGFDKFTPISPARVVTAPWVSQKCRYGCKGFGTNLQCPPHTQSADETRKLLDCYSTALLVQGQPPGRDFHAQLLDLEKRTFLKGYHKALVYSAGPCNLCPSCPEDEVCRNPEQARPAMEACGIDVYETVRAAGWNLEVVQNPGDFVKYIGLLLVE